MDEEKSVTHEERYHEEVRRVAEKYDLVIDIHSLSNFSYGWGVFGKRVQQFVIEKKGDVQGRVVTVVGEYNSGKTWLIKMLLGNDLVDGQATHTPGICMTFVESKKGSNETPSKPSPARRGRTGLASIRPGLGSPKRKPQPPKSSMPQFDYVILDSAGTDEACSPYTLKDVRATQIFLRKILVDVADKLIFVTAKFNQPTQIAINAIIKQLSSKPGFEITSSNRLIVVHNMMEVDSAEVLERKIAELENVYYEPEGFEDEEQRREKELNMKSDRNVASWQRVTETVTVGDKTCEFAYYNTRLTTHILLVKHSAEPNDWTNVHNMAGLHVLRTKIRHALDLRRINLLEDVMRSAQRQIHNYLVGFEATDELKVEVLDDVPYILPKKLPSQCESEELTWEDDNGEGGESQEGEGEKEEAQDWDYVPPFELKDMQFTDNDIIPEGQHYLHGSVFETKTHFILKIVMPGVVSKTQVKVKTSDFMYVHIFVRIPAAFPDVAESDPDKAATCLASDVKYGQSYYRWTAPVGKNFYNLKRNEIDAATELANGIFTLSLLKPDVDEDDDGEVGEEVFEEGEKETDAGQ